MRIAFYAPLKPPDHPVPSGDREMARGLWSALQRAGHQPVLAARLRSYDAAGDPARQARLAALGQRAAERVLRRYRAAPESAPALWFTYHLYHKAPDLIGPAVSAALSIPYVVAEASFAAKRQAGPWALGHRAVTAALQQADAVIGLNSADRDGVVPQLADPGRWVALKPFLDTSRYRMQARPAGETPRLIAVAMMRHGDKLASYRLLGRALAALLDLPWSLDVIGDGPARGDVEAALAPLGARVRWAGAVPPDAIPARLAAADLCVWPAVNEAWGMALLEAQASGVPVVAGRCGGVPEIVAADRTGLLVAPGDVGAFTMAVRGLLLDPARRAAFAIAARRKAVAEHDIAAAAHRLGDAISRLGRARAA